MPKGKKKLIKPKFAVGDVVCKNDDFLFNPANKVISIGAIQAVHIYKGESMFSRKGKDGVSKPKDYFGRITYTVSGFSLRAEEKDLQLFKGGI